MRKTLLLTLSLFSIEHISAQLIVQEISQGQDGQKEYAELVVIGTRSCTDSCADLRNWIIDDNNGWLGAGSGNGIATGSIRFRNDPAWACIPYGSIILIYNDGDKNPSILLADDETDANNDYVYVLPISSRLFEANSSSPVSPSSSAYTYPATGFTGSPSWAPLGLSNTGDAFIITAPANLSAAHFSVGYGSISNPSAATIYKQGSGSGLVYYLNDDQYTNAASWSEGRAPGNESPGAPNSLANRQWIEQMRRSISSKQTSLSACITAGDSYIFNSRTLTVSGIYSDTFPASDCDSIVTLYLQVLHPATTDIREGGCGSVTYKGITYTRPAIVNDTLFSTSGCDSIYYRVHISVDPITPAHEAVNYRACGSVVYNGNTFRESIRFTDTLQSRWGCDSIFRLVDISIMPAPQLTVTPDTAICKGNGLDIRVSGAPYIYWEGHGTNQVFHASPEKDTEYTVYGQNDNGCKDTASVRVAVKEFSLDVSTVKTVYLAGDMITLSTFASAPYRVLSWSPAHFFPHQEEKRQLIPGSENMEVLVTGISEDGCNDTAGIFIEVQPRVPELFIPTAFTPNGDGLNDQFMIVRNYPVEKFSIRIYDRWGKNIFHSEDIGSSWDGTYFAGTAPMGVYFFQIEATVRILDESRTVFRKGDLTLIR